ncbi:hypothetical protein NMG60_11011785 [Bertholletia excelsa]
MAIPRLLLSKLRGRRLSVLTVVSSSPCFSSSSIFLSQSNNLTTQNRIVGVPTELFPAPHHYNFRCVRFLSNQSSECRESTSLDSATHPEEDLSTTGYAASDDDSSGFPVAEMLVSGAAPDGGDVGGKMFLPVRAVISMFDWYHDFTGFPWWVIIASSTLALRITMLPVLILHLHKLQKIRELQPRLPPPFPPPLSGRSYIEQFLHFLKEKRAAGGPSYLWLLAPASIQIPCFLLWMTTIRRMSLDHHPGFDIGGTLWFQNLTESPNGLLGPIFPFLIASLHFVNVQISFRGLSSGKLTGLFSLLVEYYKKYLEVLALPIFFAGFFVPQGSLVYWLTNSSLTLIQQLSLNHPSVRQKLGLPDNRAVVNTANCEEIKTHDKTQQELPREQRLIPVMQLSPPELVGLSIKHLSDGDEDRAIPLLRLALDKDPEYVRALTVMGHALLQDGQLAEATEHFERAISKILLIDHPREVDEADPLIVASLWAGVACICQGKTKEGIIHLERIANLKEPEDLKSKSHYYDALILLAKALLNKGRKTEATEYLHKAVAYDSAYKVHLEECEKDEDDFVNDLVVSRRRDY